MITGVLWGVTILCAVACIVFYLISKKVEPSPAECKESFKKSQQYISDKFNKELEEARALQAKLEAEGAPTAKVDY